MKYRLITAVLATVWLAGAVPAASKNKGGLLGNSYSSQLEQVNDTSFRIISRKKVRGTLDEINVPGSTVNKAFAQVADATLVRAAVEARNLGFKVIRAGATRDLSKTLEKRSVSMCPGGICENAFVFAYGHYFTDVEMAIEVTFDLTNTRPADTPGYYDVGDLLAQYGL